jgi:uncharacterized protein YceK
MRRTLPILMALGMLPAALGCGTVGNFTGKEECQVFGGVRLDSTLMAEGFGHRFENGQPEKVEGPVLLEEGFSGLVDLPLSLIGDTLTLPITIPLALTRPDPPSDAGAKAEKATRASSN